MATRVGPMRRLSRVEYERLVDRGMFQPGDRLEQLDGVLVVREPQNARHATAVRAIQEALAGSVGRDAPSARTGLRARGERSLVTAHRRGRSH